MPFTFCVTRRSQGAVSHPDGCLYEDALHIPTQISLSSRNAALHPRCCVILLRMLLLMPTEFGLLFPGTLSFMCLLRSLVLLRTLVDSRPFRALGASTFQGRLVCPACKKPFSPCSLSNAKCHQCLSIASMHHLLHALQALRACSLAHPCRVASLRVTVSGVGGWERKTYGQGTGLFCGVSPSPRSPRGSFRSACGLLCRSAHGIDPKPMGSGIRSMPKPMGSGIRSIPKPMG